MNILTSNISTKDIWLTAVSIASFNFVFFTPILLLEYQYLTITTDDGPQKNETGITAGLIFNILN